jgi:uncharacterized protein DUF3467
LLLQHFISLGFNSQEHRSTRRLFHWYKAGMSVWTNAGLPTSHALRIAFPGLGAEFGGRLPSAMPTRYTGIPMANPIQPNVKLTNTSDYRENYANSVQIRVNVWDFFLVFGTLTQQSETQVEIQNFQGVYLSPQQAKALLGVLQQNVTGYENAFGEIKLDPRMMQQGPVH